MPREIKSIPLTFANTGIVLRSAPDELPITAYKALVNVITDRENSISVRKGFERLNGGLPSPPYSFYFLKDIAGYQWRYAITGHQLFVAPVTDPANPAIWPVPLHDFFQAVPGGAGMSAAADPRAIFATYTLIGYEMKPYMFVADGERFLKHAGGLDSARRIGIPKPLPLTAVVLEPNSSVTIEDFEDPLQWTPDNSVIAGVPGVVANAISIRVTGDKTVGGGYKAITVGGYPVVLDLGIADPDEVIEMWMEFPDEESALNCSEIVVTFGLSTAPNDTTFTTRFEKAVSPSSFEAASQIGSTGRTETYRGSQADALGKVTYGQSTELSQEAGPDRVLPENYIPADQFAAGLPTEMRPGTGVWNRIRVKKSEFTRAGTSAITRPDLNWNCVSAIRLDIKTIDTAVGGKDCYVYFDDFVWLTTGKLFGVDLQWTYTYYNSLTNTESDYADPVAVPYPGANYDQYRLSFPSCPGTAPPLANPDTIRIYRMGGTRQQFQLVDDTPYTAGIFPADYIDNVPDTLQGEVLNTDNQLPPDKVKGVVLFEDQIWTWGGEIGGIPEPPNRLRRSMPVRVEAFPANRYIYVGTGSEQIQNCIEHDGQLFVFTLTRVYTVIGNQEAYRAVSTPVNQGLKNPFAMVKGIRSLYMHAYDGIYEFPTGRKLSEPINQVFFGETVNEIPPIAIGRENLAHMGFFDSKVFFSYPATDDPDIGNDRMLVWDTIYERWHFYIYGAQAMYLEPENNILVGGQIVQWDSIVDGHAANFHYSGAWPMRLDTGFADHCEDGYRGIFWAVDTKDYDLGFPDQEKRFIDFVVDADTQGYPVGIQVGFDLTGAEPNTEAHDSIGTVLTAGRQRVVLPVPMGAMSGDSVLATRAQIRILAQTSPAATAATRLFKIVHRVLLEPSRHRTHVTDWSDYGNAGPKYFRTLWIELDTFGKQLDSIEVQMDQGIAQTLNEGIVATGQTRLYFGLLPDLRGTLARLKVVPRGENEVKIYDHGFEIMPEPTLINTIQSPWSEEGWPYNKLWKEVILDVNTSGLPIGFNFWVDGQIKESFTVQTASRRLVTHSIEKDTIGKLGRVTVNESYLDPNCCLPQGVRVYSIRYVIDKEPADVTLADSYDQLFAFDRLKVLRRLWIAMKNPDSDVTMEVYADEVLMTTKTIAKDIRSTGFSKRRIDLESAIKGRLIRIIFTSQFQFEIYWERSDWEVKDLNTEDGYRRERMSPPQTF